MQKQPSEKTQGDFIKKAYIFASGITSALLISTFLVISSKSEASQPFTGNAIGDAYELSFVASSHAAGASESFAPYDCVLPVAVTGGTRNVTLHFSSAKKVDDTLVMEAGSTVEKTENSNAIQSLTATFSGSLSAEFGYLVLGDYEGSSSALTSGSSLSAAGNLFCVTASAETTLTSLEVQYGCATPSSLSDAEDFALDRSDITTNTDGKYAELAYTSIAGNSYANTLFTIPSSVTEAETNTMRIFVQNTGASTATFRLDVEAASSHKSGSQNPFAINTSATWNGASISTDTIYGGSTATLAPGEKGILKITYNTIYGKPVAFKIFADSSTWDDETTHTGSFVLSNPVFSNEAFGGYTLGLTSSGPYTCVSHEGITKVTYAEAETDTYAMTRATLGDELLNEKTSFFLTIKNNGTETVEIEIGMNGALSGDTACDYFNAKDNRAKYSLSAGESKLVELKLNQSVNVANVFDAYIDSCWNDDKHEARSGDVEFSNVHFA